MGKGRLCGEHCFDSNLLDLVHHCNAAKTGFVLFYVLKDVRERPFVAAVIFFGLVLHEIARSLVDCVVSQMHEQVVQIALARPSVGLSREPGQSLFEQVHAQWLNAKDEHVDSQVELQVVNQVRLGHVPLRDQLFSRLEVDVVESASQENTLSLAHAHWLDDEGLGFLFVKLVFQFIGLRRQQPSFREKVVFFLEVFGQAGEVAGQVVFPAESPDTRGGVNSLVLSELCNFVRLHTDI